MVPGGEFVFTASSYSCITRKKHTNTENKYLSGARPIFDTDTGE